MSVTTTTTNDNSLAPAIIVIAGNDPSGGAGLAQDIRVAHYYHCRTLPILSAITCQSIDSLTAVQWVQADLLEQQLLTLIRNQTQPFQAIKLGLSCNIPLLKRFIEVYKTHLSDVPLIYDPVLQTGNGYTFYSTYQDQATELRELICFELLPLVTVCTPNLLELQWLLSSSKIDNANNNTNATKALTELPCQATLLTGGHSHNQQNNEQSRDDDLNILHNVLYHKQQWFNFKQTRYLGNYRGTGCALSTSIACHIAKQQEIQTAVETSLHQVNQWVKKAFLAHQTQLNNIAQHGSIVLDCR